MNFNGKLRMGLVGVWLALVSGVHAATEPVATNGAEGAIVSNEVVVSTNAVVAPGTTNAVGVTENVNTQAVLHAVTNQVPVVPVPQVVPQVVPVTLEPPVTGEETGWLDRVPVGAEESDVWWRNRFEIGTRITSFELTDAKRPMDNRFLGSINVLKEDQDLSPTKVYANAWLLSWLGVGLSYETLGAETWTEKPDVQPYTDGTFTVGGPILSALAAWPNSTRFTPFAEVGQWFMSGSVDADPAWANAHGIEGYQDFEITECKGGSVLGAGCAIQLTRHVELDVIYRQIKASIMVDHLLLGSVAQSGREFPLDSNWMGAGIKYRF